ncbi:MAG: DNA polymerase IV [Gammaproteobacteria bacterium]|nr:DNA polymerase IV [Gammaproteobacteria bacterium]
MEARSILHVDMDAFYASVEVRDRPELAGLPVIVGHPGPRGVVAAASYAVRRFGVRSAMPIASALRLCPQAIVVPPRIGRYREVSAQAFAIFESFTPLVEPLSLDEAFLDVTASRRLLGEPVAIAERLRRKVREEIGLTASVGVAPNKLVAKIASDLRKPDGLCRIGAEELPHALDDLPIERLWGIGAKTLPRVHAAGIRSFRDLRSAPEETLRTLFGRHAEAMRRRAAGFDERPVVRPGEERSISAECTFESDLDDPSALRTELARLVDRVGTRLRRTDAAAAQVAIKVRTSDFATSHRQRSFEPPARDTATLWRLADAMLSEWLAERPRTPIRLLGVAVSDLETGTQVDLFEPPGARASRIDTTVDEVRRRFGAARILRANQIRRQPR